MTPTQARLLQERAGGAGPRPLVVALELDGAVDGDRLDAAWRELQRRHPFLRLRLTSRGPVASEQVRPLVRGDLPGARASFQADAAQILAMAARPRDLSMEGPAEAVWLRTGPEAGLLICSVDHVASDGWAFGLLASEWSALYAGQSLAPSPDPVPILEKYGDPDRTKSYAEAVRSLVEEFDGARPFPLPHSRAGWAFQQVDLPLDVVKEARTRAAKERSTAFAFGLAALGRALWMEHGSEDLVVSTHVANRSVPQSQHIVCAAYNTVPMRLSGQNTDELRSWAGSAKQAILQALKRQHVPFSVARQTLSDRIAPEALLRVMINFDEHPFLGFALPGVEMREAVLVDQARLGAGLNAPLFSTSTRPWPAGITVSFRETWDCLQLYVHYGDELGHRAATMLLGRVTEGIALLTTSD
ncbi:MAG: condensation domain-containing protein [Acidobacteriota bacterium]|nr:condensation domain-containing protein [Acidobacteriota bacterium]